MSTYAFLAGGGEMGERTRQFDWAKTPVGSPDQWPMSLRTTVSTILSSRFPMFLWWGTDLIQFYNDAYRPSLGNEAKHPKALGQKGRECWPEIWDIIYPLISQVLTTGVATWSEDQLVPIYRNGAIEDVYWTFGYSPIRDDEEKITGVLVICTENTQKVNYLRELTESKKELEFAIDAAELGTWDLNPSTNKFTANERLREWFGLRPGEEIELPLAMASMHEDDRHRVSAAIQWALNPASGGNYQSEYRIINPVTGVMRVVSAKGKALFDDENRPLRFNGTLQDITEQKNAEIKERLARQKVEASEQQIRSLVQSAPFPIGVYTGRDMRIELANEAMIRAWGKGNDVIGQLYSDLLPELADQSIFEQLATVYNTGQPFDTKHQPVDVRINGRLQTFYFNYSFTPLFNAEGKVYGVMNTAADVTDLILAKKKVEENERNFRNTILGAPVAICIFKGPDFVVEIANERMFELWGKTSAEMMHRPVFEGLPEARHQGFEELLTKIYTTGETHIAQALSARLPRNGVIEQHYIDVLYEPEHGANGEVTGIIAVAILVTEQVKARRQIEEVVAERTKELAEANKNLERSNAELSQFAHIASHDLQEPIRKMVTYSSMLEELMPAAGEQAKSFLQKVKSASQRMQVLVRDILAYSELSKQSPVFEPVNLQQVMQEIRSEFELLIEQKNATLDYKELPVINAIPLQMTQLFSNLISNALKYTSPDKAPHIEVTANVEGGQVHIEVRDNGIGFEQQYADRIFSIFQRLHRKTEYDGTGIGLSICKKIAQNHKGDIYAIGEPGKGATFHLLLPLHHFKND